MNKVLDFKNLPELNSQNMNLKINININVFLIKFLKATESKNPYIFNFRK